MKSKPRQDRAWLLAVAKDVAKTLKVRAEGTRVRVRMPDRTSETNTAGWRASIGDLGMNEPRLEVWFDRFSGYPQRKLFACFYSKDRPPITSITRRVASKLWPARVITMEDTQEDKYLALKERLPRDDFNAPVLERYRGGPTFYGIYDPTRDVEARVNHHFSERAAAFFEDVARALPDAKVEDEQREVYPRLENRRRVASHLQRERSRLLAAECKIRDGYECQVCDLRFEDLYGQFGRGYAEAHHRVPLDRLRENVKTRLEELTTVCANCHRMLHRMEGRSDDIKKLRAIVRNRRT